MLTTPISLRKSRIKWTIEIKEVILKGLIKAIQKRYYINSFYKAKGLKLALNYILAITNQAVNLKQVKSKYNSYKKD